MRRHKQEITGQGVIDIIKKSLVCRLGMSDEGLPYIVPMCFGLQENTLYFHSASQGMKIDILKKNPRVCFEFDINPTPEPNENPCMWGMGFRSVIGFGNAVFVTDTKEKEKALNVIMNQYSPGSHEFDEKYVKSVAVIRVDIESMTGKRSSDS